MWRKLSVIFVVSLLVCSSLLAFPTSKKSLPAAEELPAQEIPAPVTEVTAEEAPAEAPQEVAEPSQEEKRVEELETALEAMSKKLESLQSEVDSTKVITSSKKSDLDNLVSAIASDVEIVLADLEEKEAIITELAEANASQADQLAYIQGRYDKEISSKFFADFGGVIGFKEKDLLWGLTGNLGIRFGKGLLVGTGVQYMLGTFGSKPSFDWSIDNLTVSMKIGWEW